MPLACAAPSIAALARPALAAKLTDMEHTRIEEPRPAGVPSDAVMEAEARSSASIEIEIRNIFDESDPRENTVYYHARQSPAPSHQARRRSRRSCCSRAATATAARALAETERNCASWSTSMTRAWFRCAIADGKVDIKVITKDVWTLSPGISFGRAGGTNATGYNLQDSNFLGWGKTLRGSRASNVDRTSNTVEYADPNVFGSHWTADAGLCRLERRQAARAAGRATFLFPRYAVEREGLGAHLRPHRVPLQPGQHRRSVQRQSDDLRTERRRIQTAWSTAGPGVCCSACTTTRINSCPRRSTTCRPIPCRRTEPCPIPSSDSTSSRTSTQKIGDQNQIGRTEDLYFGTEVTGQVGYSNGAFGADTQCALILAATVLRGFELPDEQQLFLSGNFSSRVEGGRARNLIADGSRQILLALAYGLAAVCGAVGHRHGLARSGQAAAAGGDNGLRGYPLRYESGTSRGILTVEQRVFTDWYPFRLARVGARRLRGCGPNMGQRQSSATAIPGLLQRRRLWAAPWQHAHRPRQRGARRFRLPVQRQSPASRNSNSWCRRSRASELEDVVCAPCAARPQPEKADAHREIEHPPAELAGAVLVLAGRRRLARSAASP